MGPSLYKYLIGECSFNKITSPAIVGIFSLENDENTPTMSVLSSEFGMHIRRSITVGSYVTSCTGYPSPLEILHIVEKEHTMILDAYVNSIPQDKIFIFEDGTKYSRSIMQILVEISKNHKKHVTCLSILPAKFEQNIALNRFNQTWDVIKDLADESDIFDFELTNTFHKKNNNSMNMAEYFKLRAETVLEHIKTIESGFDGFQYGSRETPNYRR